MARDGAKAEASGARGWTVLVVDDEDAQRAAVAELLSSGGYVVVVACDGEEAVALLATGVSPDLIVLDLTMPGMDGWSFLRHLRESAKSEVPVLVTSAVAREHPPEGADACLEKPFDPAHFRALVARLSSGARGMPEAEAIRGADGSAVAGPPAGS